MFYYILLFFIVFIIAMLAFWGKIRLRLLINGLDCIIEGDIMLFSLPIIKRALHFTFIDHKILLHVLGKRVQKKKHKKKKHSKFKVKDVLTGIVLKKIILSINIGTGYADKTAVLAGALYSALSFAVCKTGNKSRLAIEPDFYKKIFLLEGECIIKVKVIHIIHKLLFK